MAFSTKLKIIDAKMEQPSGGTLTLSGDTTIADSGSLQYASHPTFVADEQIVDKKYVDDNVSSGATYNLDSPSTVEVGGIEVGTTLTGKTSNEILEEMLVPYIEPTFTSFSISAEPTTREVGTSTSGIKPFVWSTSNSENVATNSVDIRDVTANALIATGLANDGSEGVDIGTINFTTYGQTQQWRGEADSTEATPFQSSNFTVTSYFPWYYGKVNAPGNAGENRPTATESLVLSGTKTIASSSGTITIDWDSGDDDYIWFAVPNDAPTKTEWYETVFNNGDIGGAVSVGGNLFPDFDTVSVTNSSPAWGPKNYEVYISNWQTSFTENVEIRN